MVDVWDHRNPELFTSKSGPCLEILIQKFEQIQISLFSKKIEFIQIRLLVFDFDNISFTISRDVSGLFWSSKKLSKTLLSLSSIPMHHTLSVCVCYFTIIFMCQWI